MTPSRPSLARRALPALVLTGASGLLLSALDRPGGSADASTIDTAGTADGGVTVVSVVSAPAAAATTVPPTPVTTLPETTLPAVVLPVPVDPATTAAPTTVATTVASTVPPAPVTTAAATCTVLDGPTVSTKWGPVQVEAAVTADGQICTVDAIVTPSDHGKSVRINDRAVPVLNENAMAAQSTVFNGVSGATITSNAYKQSLQAILDSLV